MRSLKVIWTQWTYFHVRETSLRLFGTSLGLSPPGSSHQRIGHCSHGQQTIFRYTVVTKGLHTSPIAVCILESLPCILAPPTSSRLGGSEEDKMKQELVVIVLQIDVQSRVWRTNRRRLSTQPCGAPVLTVSRQPDCDWLLIKSLIHWHVCWFTARPSSEVSSLLVMIVLNTEPQSKNSSLTDVPRWSRWDCRMFIASSVDLFAP